MPIEEDDGTHKKRVKKLKALYKPLTDWWRSTLAESLDSVVISQRLVDDPCVVVSTE
jgi:heat shock protein beta